MHAFSSAHNDGWTSDNIWTIIQMSKSKRKCLEKMSGVKKTSSSDCPPAKRTITISTVEKWIAKSDRQLKYDNMVSV